MSDSFCVIPARKGSKGLKDKNILMIDNKPIIAYTIEACLESGIFEDVYVATDSEEYADIAEKYGAKVPFLEPADMAGDFVSSTEPVIHMYKELKKESEYMWCMQPTSPLRKAEDIVNAYNVIKNNSDCDFVLSVTEIDPHYFHWALEERGNKYELYFGSEMLVDRSELLKVYRPNGAIKVGRTQKVLEYRHYFGENIKCVYMPEERSIHIRNKMDYQVCDLLINAERK